MAGRQLLTQLGREDIILSGQPEITFFKEQYKPQGLFASRIIEVSLQANLAFGEEIQVEIPLIGDLITAMYARFDFPVSLLPTLFTQTAGLQMLDFAELYSGVQILERLWGEYIGLLAECQVPTSKQSALANTIGAATPNVLNIPSSRYTVNLPFKTLERGLPLCKKLNFRIKLNQSSTFTSPPLSSIPTMQFRFLVEFVILNEPERNWIKKRGKVFYIGEIVQRSVFNVPGGISNVRCVTQFLNPTKELFFTIRNKQAGLLDYWLDYSNATSSTNSWAANYSNIHQLNSMGMYFEGVERVNPLWATSIYLGTTQFMDYHTRVPVHPFYMYSFALDPENTNPTGSVNFGRIKNQYFDLFMAPSINERIITIWARCHTFLEVDGFEKINNIYENSGDDGYIVYLR